MYLRIEVPFFCLHLEMKGHWSHVNLVKRFSKIYMRPVSFHFPMQIKSTSILIFMLERQITPKKWKKINVNFYTPVFRRVVLWYGDVCPSVRPSVHPSRSPSGSLSVSHSFPHFSPSCFDVLS